MKNVLLIPYPVSSFSRKYIFQKDLLKRSFFMQKKARYEACFSFYILIVWIAIQSGPP